MKASGGNPIGFLVRYVDPRLFIHLAQTTRDNIKQDDWYDEASVLCFSIE